MKGFIGMHERLRHIEELSVEAREKNNTMIYAHKKNGDPVLAHPAQLEKALEIFRWILEGEL